MIRGVLVEVVFADEVTGLLSNMEGCLLTGTVEDFLYDVWAHQPPGYGFWCQRSGPTSWHDQAVQLPDVDEELWLPKAEDGDLYFTPNVYSRPRRRRELMVESRWLYADLDHVDPAGLDPRLKPTVAWQSSPGRYQAMWLTQLLSPDTHQKLNKQLTYLIDADKGGWDSTQVLRIPGTLNHKYDELPTVELLWWNNRQLHVRGRGATVNTTNGHKTLKQVEVTKPLPVAVRSKLKARRATGDRSRVLLRLEMQLLEAGFTKAEVFSLLRPTVWNKFSDSALSADIHRAAERVK